MRIHAAFNRAVAATVALAALAGCATGPSVALAPHDSVHIVVSHAPGWPVTVRVLNESTGNSSREALVGAGAGALAGGAWGLACGPLAVLCVPLGAVAGADVGLLAGLAVGTTAALPDEKADRLRARVDAALRSDDFRRRLAAEVTANASEHWSVAAGAPTVTVDVELRDFALASTRDERIRCRVAVAVAVHPPGQKSPPRAWRVHEFVGPYGSLSDWLDDSQGLAEATLAAAGRDLAARIVAGLAEAR